MTDSDLESTLEMMPPSDDKTEKAQRVKYCEYESEKSEMFEA